MAGSVVELAVRYAALFVLVVVLASAWFIFVRAVGGGWVVQLVPVVAVVVVIAVVFQRLYVGGRGRGPQ